MTNVGSKTPVSTLQELMANQQKTLSYELIHNGAGTHDPIFIYRVTAGDLWAQGEGHSKQQAKHHAASNLLSLWDKTDSHQIASEVSNISLPQENEISYNAVGELKDYCAKYNHPEAVFDIESDEGPPHARVFTMKCHVSKLAELGVARTKKQAKQISAHNMLMRLKKQAGEEVNALVRPGTMKSPERKLPSSSLSDEKIIEKYSDIKGLTTNQPAAALYKDHERAFLGIQEKSVTLQSVISNINGNGSIDVVETVERIAVELGLHLSDRKIPTEVESEVLILLSISTSPPITCLGNDLFDASSQMIRSFIILCQ